MPTENKVNEFEQAVRRAERARVLAEVKEALNGAMYIHEGDDPAILDAALGSVKWCAGAPYPDELQHAIGTFIDAALATLTEDSTRCDPDHPCEPNDHICKNHLAPSGEVGGDEEPLIPWRTGRKLGRTLYAQPGPEPDDGDPLLGFMETPDLAARVVAIVNRDQGKNPLTPSGDTTGGPRTHQRQHIQYVAVELPVKEVKALLTPPLRSVIAGTGTEREMNAFDGAKRVLWPLLEAALRPSEGSGAPLPEGEKCERVYLVRCGKCGFLGESSSDFGCQKCGYDGGFTPDEKQNDGAEWVRLGPDWMIAEGDRLKAEVSKEKFRDMAATRLAVADSQARRCTCEGCPMPWRDPNCAIHGTGKKPAPRCGGGGEENEAATHAWRQSINQAMEIAQDIGVPLSALHEHLDGGPCPRCSGETYMDRAPSTFGGHPKVRCLDCKPEAESVDGEER